MSAPLTATSAKADTALFPFLARLMRREDLSASEAADFFRALIEPNANPAQVAAALTALTAKGETHEELAGMASVMRAALVKVPGAQKGGVDIVGTGSSAVKTFSVSTAAALVAAGAGLTVAKQCNRGVMSRTGSADVLGELGVTIADEPGIAQISLRGTGLCFLFAAKFHPQLRRVGDIRSSLGIRTCLNVLGLLANPASVSRHVIGVWHRSLVEPVARALAMLKTDAAWVVHGSDGLDEVTLSGKTFIGSVQGDEVRAMTVTPADFGLKSASIEHLRAKSAKDSAKMIRDVLASRRRDEARSLVVLNAAAAMVVGGVARDPMQAARMAEKSIDSGQAQNKLDRLVQITNK
jgi:anthranilate phosphoribosyltransferase